MIPGPLFPCDDEYVHIVTGEPWRFYSTTERHLDMPSHVADPTTLYDLAGVRPMQSGDRGER